MEESGGREYLSTAPEEQLTIDRGAIRSGEPESHVKLEPAPRKRSSRRKR
jgi:hypothetical protein